MVAHNDAKIFCFVFVVDVVLTSPRSGSLILKVFAGSIGHLHSCCDSRVSDDFWTQQRRVSVKCVKAWCCLDNQRRTWRRTEVRHWFFITKTIIVIITRTSLQFIFSLSRTRVKCRSVVLRVSRHWLHTCVKFPRSSVIYSRGWS